MNHKWHKRLLRLAHEIASWSKDRSTKVGAVIVDEDRRPKSFGYNGFPRNVDDDIEHRHERPAKYFYAEHAERNAIYNAETSLKGCTIYVTHFPCADCARAIIQKDIATVVVDASSLSDEILLNERYAEPMRAAREMFAEAGVQVLEVDPS